MRKFVLAMGLSAMVLPTVLVPVSAADARDRREWRGRDGRVYCKKSNGTTGTIIGGVGGGTVRDLLIGAPVFWVHDARAASVCLGMALLIWVTPERWWKGEALGWFDAVGLAAYAVYGAAKALGYGVPPVPAALMGVMTACVGGIIRDVLAGEPSILMRPELYVTAAALASASYVGLVLLGVPLSWAAVIAASAGFTLRAAAIRFHLALPAYGGRH